jgi:hypothetical protein
VQVVISAVTASSSADVAAKAAGVLRAGQVREVARTLEDVDVVPTMAMATADRQEWVVEAMGEHGVSYSGEGFSWRELVDALGGRTKSGD